MVARERFEFSALKSASFDALVLVLVSGARVHMPSQQGNCRSFGGLLVLSAILSEFQLCPFRITNGFSYLRVAYPMFSSLGPCLNG